MSQVTAEKAWFVLLTGVAGYELVIDEDNLLSRGFDRFIEKHPIITYSATLITVAHLLNLFDAVGLSKLDPFTGYGFNFLARTRALSRRIVSLAGR